MIRNHYKLVSDQERSDGVSVLVCDRAMEHCVMGRVVGPCDAGDRKRLSVEFESPGGRYSMFPTEISRIMLKPEDLV